MKNNFQIYKTIRLNFMKTALLLIFMALALISCSWNQSKPDVPGVSGNASTDSAMISKDTLIFDLTDQVLTTMKNKNYAGLSEFFHPVLGVRFSPYAFIDTSSDVKLTKAAFMDQIKKRNKLNWGSFDGSGESIHLTIEEYFTRFVYSADFFNAEQKSLNKVIGRGNTLNNIEAVYKGCDFIECYFPGFDKKLEGIDWCSLRLIFKEYRHKYFLVGVVHDQWTI